jgi:phage tail-like protein
LEYEIVGCRRSLSKQLGEQKMPGRPKVTEVALKKGVFAADNGFYEWIMTNHNKLKRQDVVVKLLDETFSPKMTWTLLNAWPTKIEGPSFKGDSNEVAVESITLAYEEMKIDKV